MGSLTAPLPRPSTAATAPSSGDDLPTTPTLVSICEDGSRAFAGLSAMELSGLEPLTSWVRFRPHGPLLCAPCAGEPLASARIGATLTAT
jgi:hypothetical protein